MLCVDKGGNTALLLRFCDHMERDRRLAGGFRAVELRDAAARKPADAERDIERQNTGRNDGDVHVRLRLAKAHDRTLAEILLNLLERLLERLLARHRLVLFCHETLPPKYAAKRSTCIYFRLAIIEHFFPFFKTKGKRGSAENVTEEYGAPKQTLVKQAGKVHGTPRRTSFVQAQRV